MVAVGANGGTLTLGFACGQYNEIPQLICYPIAIVRTVGRLRSMFLTQVELGRRLDDLESRSDQRFAVVLDATRELAAPLPKRPARQCECGKVAKRRAGTSAKRPGSRSTHSPKVARPPAETLD